MRGRKPTPTTLRVLRGNPGRRPLNAHEAKPAAAGVHPPAWLTNDVAALEWGRIAPILNRLGLLTEIDEQALAAYCQAFARWRDAEAQIDKFGTVVKGKGGFPMISPFFSIADRTARQMRAYLIEFGMTPSARSRVHTHGDEGPADPFSEFDAGRLERWTPAKKTARSSD
jgi:P27 family predicted phage terminase small subunit